MEKLESKRFRLEVFTAYAELETIMVSRGVPIEIASQMMGHKSIVEDKPYITHNKSQIAFVAFDFTDVPITTGFYAKHKDSASCNTKGGT